MNFAVCILFYEKLGQTIECVQSFVSVDFPIYVLNNGSSPIASQQFSTWSRAYSQVRIIESVANIGVSRGRNRLVQESEEQWLFFVDNDIVINTTDWPDRFSRYLNRDVDVLIPRLFNRHEGQYVEPRKIEVAGNRAYLTTAGEKEINSFPGGAALINRKLFNRLGNYDEGLFVGGEDFELALRGVLVNSPIRVLPVSDVELIHDHRQVTETEDVQAVLTRYDRSKISDSYRVIKEKHGVVFDDGWEGWVDRQVRQQVLRTATPNPKAAGDAGYRPRIALVSDVRNWAFHNIAVSIQKYLGDSYDFEIFFLNEYFPDLSTVAKDLFTASYDLIHFMTRQGVPLLFNHLLRKKDGVTDEILTGFINTPFTFSLYSHCQLSPTDLDHLRLDFNYLAKGYTVSSVRLYNVYNGLNNITPPTMVIEDGVDLSLFYPVNLDRLKETNRSTVIGWAGNSKWGFHVDGLDHKGLHSLIKPAINSLQREGLAVSGCFSDSNEGYTPHHEMVNYFNRLDIYVCASDMEGTPNPVLEAMACGLPIVSTDVGIIPELFGPLQQEFIVQERSVSAIRGKLRLLVTDPDLRQALSKENLERISEWTRQAESQKWQQFFAVVLDGTKENQVSDNSALPGSPALKKLCLDFPYHFMFAEDVNDYLADSLSWKITAPLRKVHYYYTQWVKKYREGKISRRHTGDTSG